MDMKKERIRDRVIGGALILIAIMFLLLVSMQVSAQPQHENHDEEIIKRSKNVSIGIRNGYFGGVTIQCEDERYVIENIILINRKNFNQTVLYKKLINHSKINGLKAFAGIGCHYYHSQENFAGKEMDNNKIRKKPQCIGYDIIGLDFIMGLSYKLPKLPLSISLDIKPAMELFATNLTNACFYYKDNAGLSIRYIL